METQSDKKRAYTFYAKLQGKLQDHINLSVAKLPDSREEMVELAERFWNSFQKKRKSEGEPSENPKKARRFGGRPGQKTPTSTSGSQQQSSKESNKGTQASPSRIGNPINSKGKQLECFNCGSTEHLLPECPTRPNRRAHVGRATQSQPKNPKAS